MKIDDMGFITLYTIAKNQHDILAVKAHESAFKFNYNQQNYDLQECFLDIQTAKNLLIEQKRKQVQELQSQIASIQKQCAAVSC